MTLYYHKLHPDAIIPSRAYGSAVGYDIAALCISETGRSIQMTLPPRTSRLVPTGLVLIPPDGWFIMVCSRSGMASTQPPTFVANAPGIVDPDYTGELKIILFNGGHETTYIKHGDRIAQVVLIRRPTAFDVSEFVDPPKSDGRGTKGFGSTGA